MGNTIGLVNGTNGEYLTMSGGAPTWAALVGAGITSLNGLSGATQTFAIGTAGTDFNIVSSA